ncbi:MAG: hypothetical protein NZ742_04980 [Acidobacteria bacterium]|nr:hypothetical protein [Acidobacteriota bacterium]MDW7984216.1 hypothetical protein [Acidobacteriota bacterium]
MKLKYILLVLLVFVGFGSSTAWAQLSLILITETQKLYEFYDAQGRRYRPEHFELWNPIVAPGLEYTIPISGWAPRLEPSVAFGTLWAFWQIRVSQDHEWKGSDFSLVWVFFYGAFRTRYFDISAGYFMDTAPQPDVSRGEVPLTNLSDEVYWAVYGKWPLQVGKGLLTLRAGLDYVISLKHLEGNQEVDPFDERVPFVGASYRFSVGEHGAIEVGLMIKRPTYGPTRVDGDEVAPAGHQWTLFPTITISYKKFSLALWGGGYISEYFSHGFTLSGKNAFAARRFNPSVVFIYTI